jgi:hypothetical protein
MKPVSDGGGCGKRENPGGQPPTLVSRQLGGHREGRSHRGHRIHRIFFFNRYIQDVQDRGEVREMERPRLRRIGLVFTGPGTAGVDLSWLSCTSMFKIF